MRNWEQYVREQLSLPELTPERESRIARELAAQLEDFYRDAIARGASEAQADAHARAQIRDWPSFAAEVRRADAPNARPRAARWSEKVEDVGYTTSRGWNMLSDFLRDMRYASRQLAKSPGFTAVAVLTLAFGIGANSAIFSVVNAVLLRPLPFSEPETLVRVYEVVPQYGTFSVAPANFFDWREQNTAFERIAIYNTGSVSYSEGEIPERIVNALVSWDTFDLLRAQPMLGRTFTAEEDTPGKNNVIILSYGMWQRLFGGDRNVLGRTVKLNNAMSTIIGVMPSGFYFPTRDTQFWSPIAINRSNATRGGHYLGVIARLNNHVSVEQAGAEMKAIAARLAQQYPANNAGESAEVITLHEQVVGDVRPALLTLLAAVGLVVLIACGNVANLLLVRASVRQKEIAVRTALGAGRRRLMLQMLAESTVLALAGGALGLLLAYAAIKPLQTLSAGSVPRVEDVAIDASVLVFTLALALLTGIVFGLVPAWQASRANLSEVLKEGGRTSASSGSRWLRNALVMAEVALSLVLLVGASLLLRSFAKLTNVDPGFRSENVLAFRVALPRASYPQAQNQIAFYDGLIQRLESSPQVLSAGMTQTLPMRGNYTLGFLIDGRPPLPPAEQPSANYRAISPRYFETLGIPLLRGRTFTERDAAGAPQVAIVDDAFVRRHFPNEDPLGRSIDIGNGTDGFYEIVGVVGDVHHSGLDATAEPTMYAPYAQDNFTGMWMLVRTSGEPVQLAGAARSAVRDLDRSLPAFAMQPLADVVDDSVAQRRFSMLLLALFAAIALFLAAVGLYGVLSYTVSQRTQEIGLRMALGAQHSDLMRMVVGHGMKLALIGIGVGLASAFGLASALTRFVAAQLFDVTPFDTVSYTATALAILAIAALACYLPARRALRVDPLTALRHE